MSSWFKDATGRIRSGWVIAVFTVVAVVTATVLHGALYALGLMPDSPYSLDDPKLGLQTGVNLLSALAATGVARAMGERPGLERPKLIIPGAAAAAVLLCITVGLGAVFSGALGLSDCDWRVKAGVQQLLLIGPTAVAEELWLRGTAFRALVRGTHPIFAIAGTGVVFGALHLTNPEASAVAALNVALVGIWFGAMAWRANSIWPAIGAHLAWNWFEGFFWGQHVSGIQAGCSLLTATSQPPFWGGGAFGPEASGLTAVLLALASAVTLAWPKLNASGAPPASPAARDSPAPPR